MRPHVLVEQQSRTPVSTPTIIVEPLRAARLNDEHWPVEPVEVLEHHAKGVGAGVIRRDGPRLEPRDRVLLVPLPEIYGVSWATNGLGRSFVILPRSMHGGSAPRGRGRGPSSA